MAELNRLYCPVCGSEFRYSFAVRAGDYYISANCACTGQKSDRHGDNDWPDDLHLADVIDKHLARHLGGE
jgi:hypothetical protein